MERQPFSIGEYYHVYNRGNDRRNVFLDETDYQKFLGALRRIRKYGSTWRMTGSSLNLRIVAFCLNPNHFHFVVQQTAKVDISRFFQQLCTSYTMYFNKRHRRSGTLFQGPFRSSHVDSDPYLTWVTNYVNGNAELHGITKDARLYPWSSYPEYLSPSRASIFNDDLVLRQFEGGMDYDVFAQRQIKVMKSNRIASFPFQD